MKNIKDQTVLSPEVQLVKSILVLLPYNTDQTRVDILKSVLVKNLTSFTANDSSLQDHVTLLAPVKMTKEKSETRAHRSKWHANIPAFFNFNGGLFFKQNQKYLHGLKSDTKNIQILKKDLHFFTAHFIKANINGEKFKRYTSSQPKITL
jgi:hypothetical protein